MIKDNQILRKKFGCLFQLQAVFYKQMHDLAIDKMPDRMYYCII